MADLEASLRRLYPELPPTGGAPPDGGLAEVKRRGRGLRRRRRAVPVGLAVGVLVAMAGFTAAGSFDSTTRHQVISVSNGRQGPNRPQVSPPGPVPTAATGPTPTTPTSTTPATTSGTTAAPAASVPTTSASTTPTATSAPTTSAPVGSAPGAEAVPTRYIAELSTERIGIVATGTGQVQRLLTTTADDVWGTLGDDGTVFYLSAPPDVEANCPSGSCAIDIATGVTTALPDLRWGGTTPNPLLLAIGPTGREAADTTPGGSTVTVATSTGDPRIYALPPGSETNGPVAWSPDGSRLAVTVETSSAGRETGELAVVDVASGAVQPLISAGVGCQLLSPALTDTELFAAGTCGSSARIARFDLATGATRPPIDLLAGQTLVQAVEPDASGGHLLVDVDDRSGGATSGALFVVTPQGHWTAVPGHPAAFAWLP